jgi:hypothetical protein
MGGVGAIGEEAVVADPGEARREDVLEEAAQEPHGVERHGLVRVVIRVVAPGEGDVLAIEREDALVGDGDAVGVVGQVGEHLLGASEGRFGVRVPVRLVGACEQEIEGLSVGDDLGRKAQRAVDIGLTNGVAEQCAEVPGERLDGEEEIDLGNADPAATVAREAASGNQAVDVGMEDEGLPPGVKNGEDAHARTKPRGAEVEQGLARAAKQNGIDDLGRVASENIEDGRDGEDDVKVRDVENFVAPCIEPLLAGLASAAGTVTIAARVPEDVLAATEVTAVAMTAKGGRAAVGDGAHHLALGGAHGELLEKLTALCANDGAE